VLSTKYTLSNESEVKLDSVDKSNNFDSEKWMDVSYKQKDSDDLLKSNSSFDKYAHFNEKEFEIGNKDKEINLSNSFKNKLKLVLKKE